MNIQEYCLSQGVELTSSQRKALSVFDEFINSDNFNTMILNGGAGTGKTFLIKLITSAMNKKERTFQVCTPTGKAAQVLRAKGVEEPRTIHSKIYVKSNAEIEEDTEELIVKFKLRINQDPIGTVYFVDEASMISDIFSVNEMLRFGSGCLLSDLLKFVSPNKKNSMKIVFIGDRNQLPPVNDTFSPALDKNYLEELSFNLKVKEVTLNEVVRQAKDSPIVQNANVIKNYLEKKYFAALKLNYEHENFRRTEHDIITEKFCRDFKDDSEKGVLITYSNANVTAYNMAIREYLYNEPAVLEKNERIIITRNNPLYGVLNGTMGTVKYVNPEPIIKNVPIRGESRPVQLIFRETELSMKNDEGEEIIFRANIFENLLTSPEPGITKKEARGLLADFNMRHKELKKGSEEYIKQLESDPFFNCLLIKYGYAITCHKAQGGEWPHVYFDFCYPTRYSEMYFRFCYTGITRAKVKLFAINPPPAGLVFTKKEEADEELPFEPEDPAPKAISPEDGVTKLIEEEMETDKEKYELRQLQYCVRVAQGDTVTDVHYNKKGVITRVMIISGGETNPLVTKLKKLEGKGITDANVKEEKENPFLTELYKDVCSKISAGGVTTEKVEHFKYQERYHFMKDDEKCSFNFYYDGKGRVTRKLFHTGSEKLGKLIEEQFNG